MEKFIAIIVGLITLVNLISCDRRQTPEDSIQKLELTSDNWNIEDKAGEPLELQPITYQGKKAIELPTGAILYSRSRVHKNFETNFYFNSMAAPGIGFRVEDTKNYEFIYFRLSLSGKRDAIQYVPVDKGSLPWQLYNYPQYEGEVDYPQQEIGALPLSVGNELNSDSISNYLSDLFADQNISVDSNTRINPVNDSVWFAFTPNPARLLMLKRKENDIKIVDLRKWVHAKIKVIDKQASVYIEDMDNPVFIVNDLKRDPIGGGILFSTQFDRSYFGEIFITKLSDLDEKDTLASRESTPEESYLNKWKISQPFYRDSVNLLSQIDSIDRNGGGDTTIQGDKDGLVNISSLYGDMNKTVLLTSEIQSEDEKTLSLQFDYVEHLTIIVNNEVVFDKGTNFFSVEGKGEEGRVFVTDESVDINLKSGSNRINFVLSGDSEYKFGWGFIAQLESMKGITVINEN